MSFLGLILILAFGCFLAMIGLKAEYHPVVSAIFILASLFNTGWAAVWFIREGVGRTSYFFIKDGQEHLHHTRPRIIDSQGYVVDQGVVHGRLFNGYVLQLRRRGWFRRCRLLHADKLNTVYATATNWKISSWQGYRDIHLTDNFGHRRGSYAAAEAYRIMTNYYSFQHMDQFHAQRLAALRIALSFFAQMHQFLAGERKGTGWGDSKYAKLMREAISMVQESIRNQLLNTDGGSAVTDLITPSSDNSAKVILDSLTKPAKIA